MAEAERRVKAQHAAFAEYAAAEPDRTCVLDYETLVTDFPSFAAAELGIRISQEVYQQELAIRLK
jgi:hypothetical protein